MQVFVLGAGIIGVTTAYELARDGHEVTVFDQCPSVGLETSFANGGQLAANHSEPWAGPGTVSKALKWLGKHDAPLLYRLRLDPALWAWTVAFISNCGKRTFSKNTAKILRLALYSRERYGVIRGEHPFDHDLLRLGILNIYHDDREYELAIERAKFMTELGCERQPMDLKSCIKLEPALAHSTLTLSGGTWSPHDESGDCYKFTQQLADKAAALGVKFRFNTRIKRLQHDHQFVTGLQTDQGRFDADLFVLAMGSNSQKIAKPLGVSLGIYPAKGYSVTLPLDNPQSDQAPHVSLTDDHHKLVFSRLGDTLRIAGTAEFAGYDTTIDTERAALTLNNALSLFPNAGDPEKAIYWAGLRPLTANGIPALGWGRYKNLLLNTGHGTLGWTLAAGCARITADLARDQHPDIDMQGLYRFN